MNNKNLESALAYVKRFNFAVFPVHSITNNRCSCSKPKCNHPGKHPRNIEGVKGATKDIEQILKWWRKWPEANIGVACGKVSNITVLDVDIKLNCDGRETLKELESINGFLPLTPIQISGSGGNHYFFQHESSLKNKVDFLPGLDIRNDGGYIIMAPSNHISGSKYVWEVSHHIANHAIEKMPPWLVDLANKNRKNSISELTNTDNDKWIQILKGISEGGRNNAATSLVGHLFYKNVDLTIILWIMQQWNSYNKPPLDSKELEKIIISIGKMRGLHI